MSDRNLAYLFAAFAVTWAAFFAYVFYLGVKSRELRREIELLRKLLEKRDESPSST